jgi:hypothetical protein
MQNDEPFYSPNRRAAPAPAAQPGEPVWRIRKADGRQLDCELRSPEWGVEVQLFRDLEFLNGRRWPTRELAQAHASELREHFIAEGGVMITTPIKDDC